MLHWRPEGKRALRKRLPCMKFLSHVWHDVWHEVLTRLELQTLMQSPLYAALETWEKRGLEEEMHKGAVACAARCMVRGWKVRFLCLLCWHKQNLAILTWQPPPDMPWWGWGSLEVKYFFQFCWSTFRKEAAHPPLHSAVEVQLPGKDILQIYIWQAIHLPRKGW